MNDRSENTDDAHLRLDALIRASGARPSADFEQPRAEVIFAFLKGQASDSERQQVLRALDSSAEFRAELVAIAQDMEELSGPELEKQMATTHVEPVPDEVVARIDAVVTNQTNKTTVQRKPISVFDITKRMVAGLAAVLVLAMVGLQFIDGDPEPRQWASIVDIEGSKLLSLTVRGTERDTVPVSYETPREAALSAFQRVLRLEGGAITPMQLPESRDSVPGHRSVPVLIVGVDGTSITILSLPIRNIERGATSLWMLSLPARKLHRLPISSQDASLTVGWHDTQPDFAIFTVTQEERRGVFVATPAIVVGKD